ncbi:MAG: outer membrane beta-barrel protein [Bacteroidales bacterium]|nr:outer membrane beta-barrel protein [Bacteroidales bacterium]
MKKNIILVFMLLTAMGLSAQQMYFGFSAGYHIGAAKTVLGTETATDGTMTNIYGTNGKGILPELRFGYMFDDNWGLELGLSYLLGSKQLVDADYSFGAPITAFSDESYSKSTMIRFAPQLVFKTEMGVYSRVGLYIPLTGKTIGTRTVDVTAMGVQSVTEQEVTYKGRYAVGFTGALGYSFEMSDQIHLFGELQYISLRIYRNTAELTVYTIDGKDQMGTLTNTIQKEFEYVDELPANANTDVSKPMQLLTSATPYHSFGINIGVKYILN